MDVTRNCVGLTGIVTGGASGIGAACGRRLAAAGATIALVDVDGAGLDRQRDQLASEGHEVAVTEADVTDEGSLHDAFDDAVGAAPLDFVVACAGITGEGRANEITLADWNRVLAVNLTGVWLTAKMGLDRMTGSGGGSIVVMSSIAGVAGMPGIAAYAAAKGGVVSLARQMARDFASDNVRVNAICPGPIHTPLVEEAWGTRGISIEEGATAIPLGRLGNVADVAALVHLLVGPEGTWMTGQALTIDGGLVQLVRGVSPEGA